MTSLTRLRAILSFLFNRPLRVQLGAGQMVAGNEAHLMPADLSILPVMAGGAPDPDPDPEPEPKKTDDPEPAPKKTDPEPAPDPDPDPEPEPKPKEDWKGQSRKHEREAKKARKELDEERDKLKKREDADKSEQEKAVEKAREEGKTEALTAAEKDRRQDRLEVAVARAAGKPIKVGEGDDAKTLKFADPEDAQIYLDRAVANGDLDAEDIFDDKGKVKGEAVTGFLQELLDERPRLAVDTEEKPKPKGGADGGRGGAADEKPDMNDLLRRK